MLKEEKIKVVEELKGKLDKSKSFYLTDFSGLNVEDINQLRKDLKNKGIEFKVVKNTLLKLAVKDLGLDQITKHLEGPTGVAFGYSDPIMPAKILHDFKKKTEKPKIKAFWIEKEIFQPDKFVYFATLPTKDQLLIQVLGCFNFPLINLVGTFDGILREFIGTIEAFAKSKTK